MVGCWEALLPTPCLTTALPAFAPLWELKIFVATSFKRNEQTGICSFSFYFPHCFEWFMGEKKRNTSLYMTIFNSISTFCDLQVFADLLYITYNQPSFSSVCGSEGEVYPLTFTCTDILNLNFCIY